MLEPALKQMKALTVIMVLLVTSVITRAEGQAFSAGYEVLRITDDARSRPIHLDIWYPTTSQKEQPQNYGFGTGHVARGAKPTGEKLPVVMLSHGAFGAASNYSWIAERLARRGFVVLGVSHYGESPVFGPSSMDPAAASRFRHRAQDLDFALSFLLERSSYSPQLDPTRVAAVGHSSGGATALMLAGAVFSPHDFAAHCRSATGNQDKGCRYTGAVAAEATQRISFSSNRRLSTVVVLDPAVGPGFTDDSLRSIHVPTLVAGAVQNDFLPYEAHAGRVAGLIPAAKLVKLEHGEGHFVFVDECALSLEAQGVPLCSDRQGIDRKAVHEEMGVVVSDFLAEHLKAPL